MLKLFIIVLLCQTVSSKLIQKEDYNYIKQNWYSYKGQSDIDTINSEKFIGGINSFKQETILQHHYYLQSHYQLTIRIRAILSNCVNNFVVQLDDARSTIASSQMNPSLIIDMELSYFHTSQSAFFALQASGLPSCSNQNTWWGIFAIEIHVLDCQEFEDYCLPGSNSKWLLLISQLHSKLNDWKITSNGSSTQNLQGIDFEILLRHYSGTFQLQRYILIPFPTKVKFQFKLFFDNQPQEIKIMINDFQTLWPIDKFLNYFVEPGGKTWWIYNIEIDIHNHKSDQLSIILIFNDSASNKVSVLDFIVFYQEQKIALPPILGCLNIIDQNCIFCDIGWQLNLVEQKCIPICGDNKLYKDCDNDNHNANDGCYYCEFQCSSDCQRCNFGRCLEWSNIYNLDQQYYNNYEQVLDCKNNQGYFFDVLFDLCQPICGDQIKTLEEECDDGNNLFNDGCLNCKFICSDNCMNCQYGKCYECNPGFIINKFKCIPKCGDELVKADEICDDGNNIRFDGCHKCQSSCQLECINCYNSHCIECLQGWNIVEGKCEKSCGDGLVAIMSNEQCDDPLDSYCVDCSYSICQDNCSICHQNQCITCFFPFQLINEICQPICGDSIVSLQFEQCDDGNEIPFDGCHECQYSCSYGCILCEQDNICKQCEQNLFFLDPLTAKCKQINQLNNDIQKDQINSSNSTTNILCNQNYVLIQNICVNLCGNGLLNSYYEECDDGNNNGGDGCSSLCTLEEFYQCINLENQLTTCTFIKPPDFNLNSLSDKKNQTQIIELTFTKSVKLMYPSQIEEIIIFRITPEIIHQLTIVPQLNISIHLNNPIYQVFIQFQEYVENPKLEVQISKYVIQDEFNLELYNYNKSINLGNPFIISETTKQQVVSIVKFNDAMMYSLASIAGLALLTGNILMILNLLDLLQSLSYIRYMQYQFPPHLRQFLETYTKVSLKPILDYFKVDQIIAELNGGYLPFKKKQSSNVNSNLPLNQVYLINAKSCYFSLLASLLTYFICSAISSQLINQKLVNFYMKNNQNPKYLKLIKQFQVKIQKQCLKIKQEYFSYGIYQLYFTTLHQLAFSTLLQFPDYNFQSPFECFNSITSVFTLILLIFISFKLLTITSSRIKDISKWKYFYIGLNTQLNTQFWALNFKSFQIFRIKFYIFIIVICMNYPQIQSILLSMQSLCYSVYLCKFTPLKSNYDLVKLILRELILMVILGTFLLYSFDYKDDQLLLIGWIHIYLFTFILSTNLFIDMLEYITKAYKNYLKKQIKEEQKQYQQYYDNSLQKFILIEHNNPKY